jgi:hypothetical protein
MKYTKWITIIAGVLVVAGLIGGVTVFAGFQSAKAQSTTPVPGNGTAKQDLLGKRFDGGQYFPNQFLAQALGITEQQLQAAQQAAYKDAVQEALDQGLITQKQADQLSQDTNGFGRGLERFLSPDSGIDMDALLAKELGITTEKLQTARQEAEKLEIQQQVTDGKITQDQADMMLAQKALQAYVNPDTLLSKALGITTDQLKAYRDDNKTMSEILADLGKSPAEVLSAQTEALVAAVQQAVTDGVITQAQANAYLTSRIGGMGFGTFGGPRGGHSGGMPDGMGRGFPGSFGQPGDMNFGTPPTNSNPNGISS